MSWECSQWWKLMKYNIEQHLLKKTFFLIHVQRILYYVGFSNIISKCMHDVHKYWYNFISYHEEKKKEKKIP